MKPRVASDGSTVWRLARRVTTRFAILLVIAAFMQFPVPAAANIAMQSWLPLAPRQLEPPDKSYVTPPAVTFRWAPTEGATRYFIQIFREDLTNDTDMIEIPVDGADTYLYTGLQPGYTYLWTVRVDFATSGTNSDFFEFTLSDKPLAPRAPGGIEASNGISKDEITITWYQSYRTAYYLLQRSAPGSTEYIDLARIGDQLEYVDQEGAADDHFKYRVLACNHVGCSQPSPVDEGWKGSCQPFAAPTLVAPPNGAEITIHKQAPWYNLEWEPVPGARSHYVRIWDRDTGNTVFTNELEYENADSYEVTSIVGNLAWHVIARNPVQGCEDQVSKTGRYTARYFPPPAVPTNVQASDGTYPDQIKITWEQAPSESLLENWEVRRSTTSDPEDAVRVEGYIVNNPEYIDTGVIPGTTYYYWVEACSHADGCSELSAPDTGYAGGAGLVLSNIIYVPQVRR